MSPTPSRSLADPDQQVERLARQTNLLVFLVIAAGLGANLASRYWHVEVESSTVRALTRLLRGFLPVFVLAGTLVVSNGLLRGLLRQIGTGPLTPDAAVGPLLVGKRLSICGLAVCALISDACLLFATTVTDYLLALWPIGLLVLSRPGPAALAGYMAIVESLRRERLERAQELLRATDPRGGD
ncbi:hypothetical protein RAS1_36110 [Phycisphaerae bacterium RAS1]|nr:hypothetical protein RAS1_36110 [Phycisphaerae bacterium RAS1]